MACAKRVKVYGSKSGVFRRAKAVCKRMCRLVKACDYALSAVTAQPPRSFSYSEGNALLLQAERVEPDSLKTGRIYENDKRFCAYGTDLCLCGLRRRFTRRISVCRTNHQCDVAARSQRRLYHAAER